MTSTLTYRHIHPGFRDLHLVSHLMEKAFPSYERTSIHYLLEPGLPGNEFLALYDDNEFCGLVSLLTHEDITHILYLAIDDAFRDRGLGSKALALVHEMKAGNRIIVDIESDNPEAPNEPQRNARRRFYERNGYRETEIHYTWRHAEWDILCYGGQITVKEFDDFWKHYEE